MWGKLEFKYCKLEIFIPETHFVALQKALQEVDVGHIGTYDSCLSYSGVTSYWRATENSTPYLGEKGEICMAPEYKVEAVCPTECVDRVIEAVKAVHPYEEPVINVIPLLRTSL